MHGIARARGCVCRKPTATRREPARPLPHQAREAARVLATARLAPPDAGERQGAARRRARQPRPDADLPDQRGDLRRHRGGQGGVRRRLAGRVRLGRLHRVARGRRPEQGRLGAEDARASSATTTFNFPGVRRVSCALEERDDCSTFKQTTTCSSSRTSRKWDTRAVPPLMVYPRIALGW